MWVRRTSVTKFPGRDKWVNSDMWISVLDSVCTATICCQPSNAKSGARSSRLFSIKWSCRSLSALIIAFDVAPLSRESESSKGLEVNKCSASTGDASPSTCAFSALGRDLKPKGSAEMNATSWNTICVKMRTRGAVCRRKTQSNTLRDHRVRKLVKLSM